MNLVRSDMINISKNIIDNMSILSKDDFYSHKNERIYVHTYPKSSTYYDVYKKSWESDCLEGFNLKDLQTDILRFMGVKDEKELVKLMREKGEDDSSESIG